MKPLFNTLRTYEHGSTNNGMGNIKAYFDFLFDEYESGANEEAATLIYCEGVAFDDPVLEIFFDGNFLIKYDNVCTYVFKDSVPEFFYDILERIMLVYRTQFDTPYSANSFGKADEYIIDVGETRVQRRMILGRNISQNSGQYVGVYLAVTDVVDNRCISITERERYGIDYKKIYETCRLGEERLYKNAYNYV